MDAIQLVGEVLTEAASQRLTLTVGVDWSVAAMQQCIYVQYLEFINDENCNLICYIY